jgi:hypothetical protein
MHGSVSSSRRSRAIVVTVALSILVGGGVFLFLLLLGGPLFLAALGVVAVLAIVGSMHYLVWGRDYEQEVSPGGASGSEWQRPGSQAERHDSARTAPRNGSRHPL